MTDTTGGTEGAKAASSIDDLRRLLRDVVRRILPDTGAITDLRQLSGGASKETWSFRATGDKVYRRLILRRQPPSVPLVGNVDLATEPQLIRAAGASGVPSPAVLHVLEPGDGLGTGFIMDHVEGETIGRKIVRDASMAKARARLARQAGEILARIHAIGTATLPRLPLASARSDLAELHETYARDGQPRPVFELAFRWLELHAPPEPEMPSLVHGDFRNGNLVIGEDGIRAVLDWELSCLGDPVRDLGWLCTNSWRFGEIDKPVGGFGTRQDLLAGYASAGGRRVTLEELSYWETFGSLRWGVICLKMRARSGAGDRPLERAMIARRASETELDLLRLIAPRRG